MNPLNRNFRNPIQFNQVQVSDIEEAREIAKDEILAIRQEILSAPDDLLHKWDNLFDRLEKILNPIYLLANVHPDEAVRGTCDDASEFFFSMQNQLLMDDKMYRVFARYAEEPNQHDPVEARYLQKIMKDYHHYGFQLNEADRKRLQEIDQDLDRLEMAFHKNIKNSRPTITLTESETADLSEDFKARYKQEDGSYKFVVCNPDFEILIKDLNQERLRRQLYVIFHTRAKESNLDVLNQIIAKRNEKAKLLNFTSFSELTLVQAMAADPGTALAFLDELADKLLPKSQFDYQMLCQTAEAPKLESWNKFFFTKRYKESKHQFAEADILPFFPLEKVLGGLLGLGSRLYGIQFEIEDAPVWHSDVTCYRIVENGQAIGRFYLDLIAREEKYSLNACFAIQNGKKLDNDSYQLPESAMICSFPPPTENTPTLMNHINITHLFHEFGHLMHHQLTRSPFAMMSGTYVADDFIEMPSQIMENWAWRPDVLKMLSGHYQTGEILTDELAQKMVDAKYLNTGINTQQQVFYSALDLALNHGFEPGKTKISDLVCELQGKFTMFPITPGTNMEAGFIHLVGYASTYYGYLWSRVYADDMFSLFANNGIDNPELGQRFREKVLAVGNTVDPMVAIQDFLEREPETDAYMKTLGVV